jgi:hypothetical protein
MFTLGSLKELSTLDLTNCTALTDAALQTIVVQCPMLSNLSVELCVKVTDAGANKEKKRIVSFPDDAGAYFRRNRVHFGCSPSPLIEHLIRHPTD